MNESWRFVRTIAKKEVIEFIRDWRTLLALIIIPLMIFPALFIALPLLLESEAAELDAVELEVVWQGDTNDTLLNAFEEVRTELIENNRKNISPCNKCSVNGTMNLYTNKPDGDKHFYFFKRYYE